MARRSDIDWEAIERDYRVGQLSIRQIAEKHKVAVSAITRKAKKEKWTRDLSEQVRAQTKAGLIRLAAENAHDKHTQSAQADEDGVAAAAATNISVVTGHRRDIGAETNRAEKLGVKFDAMVDAVADIKGLALLASTHEAVVRSRARLIALEREAFGIGESDNPATPNDLDLGRTADLLSKIRGASQR